MFCTKCKRRKPLIQPAVANKSGRDDLKQFVARPVTMSATKHCTPAALTPSANHAGHDVGHATFEVLAPA